MPVIDAHKFIARVANDENLIMRMVTGSDEEIQQIASNMGLSFTSVELRSALTKTLETAELTAAELEAVVGGVGPLAPDQRERLGRLRARIDPGGLDADQMRSQSQIP